MTAKKKVNWVMWVIISVVAVVAIPLLISLSLVYLPKAKETFVAWKNSRQESKQAPAPTKIEQKMIADMVDENARLKVELAEAKRSSLDPDATPVLQADLAKKLDQLGEQVKGLANQVKVANQSPPPVDVSAFKDVIEKMTTERDTIVTELKLLREEVQNKPVTGELTDLEVENMQLTDDVHRLRTERDQFQEQLQARSEAFAEQTKQPSVEGEVERPVPQVEAETIMVETPSPPTNTREIIRVSGKPNFVFGPVIPVDESGIMGSVVHVVHKNKVQLYSTGPQSEVLPELPPGSSGRRIVFPNPDDKTMVLHAVEINDQEAFDNYQETKLVELGIRR